MRLARLVALFLILPLTGAAVAQDVPAVSFEQLTIATSAVSLASATVNPPGLSAAQYCTGVVESADVRIRMDGTAPTASVGQFVPSGATIHLRGADTVRRFQAIRAAGTSAGLGLTCFGSSFGTGPSVEVTLAAYGSSTTGTGSTVHATSPTITTPTLTSPTITGATISGTSTIANGMTITTPVLSGSVTGTYTLAGTPTITSPSITGAAITGTSTIGNGMTITTPILSGSVTGTYTLAGTPSVTSPAISNPTVTGDASSGVVVSKTVTFTENATNTVHTGTVVIPAGSTLIDICLMPTVLWTDADAGLTVGDSASANGWVTDTDLSTTDLILGERICIANANDWGGKQGAYRTTAGRFGQATTTALGGYYPTAGSVIGVVSVVTPSAAAGRLFMTVTYAVGQVTAAVSSGP